MPFQKRRLFFDIETSPNIHMVWGAGWKVRVTPESIIEERRIICISWKWEGDDTIYNAHWDKKKGDKKMLKTFSKVLSHCTEAIAHNIKKFDMPWIRTRCLFHGIEVPVNIKMVDTLTIARGVFKLNSNRLDYIAELLGFGNKIKTEYSMWRQLTLFPYSHKDSKKALSDMVTYCDQDVVLLEKVFHKIYPYTRHNTHFGVLNGGAKWTCPECGSTKVRIRSSITTAAGTQKKQMYCRCGRYYTISMKSCSDYHEWKMLQKNLR